MRSDDLREADRLASVAEDARDRRSAAEALKHARRVGARELEREARARLDGELARTGLLTPDWRAFLDDFARVFPC